MWAVIGEKLYHSGDAGEHWRVVFCAPGLGWIAADPRQPSRFYVTGSKNVYRTEDGLRFEPIGGPKPAHRIAVDSLGRVYVACWRSERPGLWRFAEGQWTRLRDDYYLANVAVDPTDPNRLAVCTNDHPYHDHCRATGVWVSADAGRSWSPANDGLSILRGEAIAFDPEGERLVFGTLGGGYYVARWPKSFVPIGTQSYTATPEDAKASAVVLPKPIIIRNGGMTQGVNIPAEWTGRFGECQASRDTTVFKVGPASLCVAVAGGKSGQAFQAFPAQGGETFTLKGYVRSAGKVKVNVAVQSFDERWTRNQFDQVKYVQEDTDWTLFEKEVTVPEWAARFNVLLLVEGEGKAWLDEVCNAAGEVDPGKPVTEKDEMLKAPPPKDKPWVPVWCMYDWRPAWFGMHDAFVERTKKADIGVVFYGDSITMGWASEGKAVWERRYAPLKAVNYGIGGDSTRQLLWRIQHGEVDGIAPKLVVLMIGTNNLYDDVNSGTDEETARGVEAVVKLFRDKLPKTKVLLLGLLPRQNDYFCGRIARINTLIKKLDDGQTVRCLDMTQQFLESPGKVRSGLYNKDQLHLAGKGYEVWATAMEPLFDEMRR